MKNRVIGIIGVGADKANWNADFEGNPKKHLGEFVSSPFCLKYAYRNYWFGKGLDVFFYKKYKKKTDNKKESFIPMSLDDNLDIIFKSTKKELEIQNKVFDYIDVACFGGAFTSNKFNKSYVGTIQFTYGVNKFDEAESVRDSLLSPFQNSKKGDSKQTTLGSRAYLTEGHFFYDFIVNPNVNKAFKDIDKDFKGFSEADYEEFKQASLQCVNGLNSVAKKGCYNEFAMFIELKEESIKYLGNISEKVIYYKDENGKGVIDLSFVEEDLLAIKDEIKNIEIYHNPTDTIVKISKFENITIKNILNNDLEIDFMELI